MFPNNINSQSGIFVSEQVKEINKIGKYEVFVISPVPYVPKVLRYKKKWNDYFKINKENKYKNIKIFYPRYISVPGAHMLFIRSIMMYFSVKFVLNNIVNKNEEFLIHSHTILPDGFVSALLKKHYPKAKTICTIHGSDINVYPNRNIVISFFTKWALKNNDKIITVSNKLKEKVNNLLDYDLKTTDVITNGINPSFFNNNNNEHVGINKKKFKYSLLFVGNLLKAKGVFELIEAFNDITTIYDNIGLYIVGEGPQKDKLKKMSQELNLQDKVVFTGRVPHKKVSEYMNICDIFILPSYREGMPTVMFEALGYYNPIIITRVGGVEEIISHKENGYLINSKSKNDIINAVKELKEDTFLYNKLSMNAAKTIDKYTWKNNAQKTIKVYEN